MTWPIGEPLVTPEKVDELLARLEKTGAARLLDWQKDYVKALLGSGPGGKVVFQNRRNGLDATSEVVKKILELEGFVVDKSRPGITLYRKPIEIKGFHADTYTLDETKAWNDVGTIQSAPPDPFVDQYVLPIVDGKFTATPQGSLADEIMTLAGAALDKEWWDGVFNGFKDVRPGNPTIPTDGDANAQATMNYVREKYNAVPYNYYIDKEGTAVSKRDLFDLTDHDLNIWRQIGSPMKDGKVDVDALRHVPRKKPSSGRYGAPDEVDIPKVLAENARLQEKQKNQKKELSRLNIVIRLQSSDIDNSEKRCKRYLADVNRQTRETIRYSDELTHEKALSSYWHNKFKDLKVKYKETKRELKDD